MLRINETAEQQKQEAPQEQMKLDDARRVKVLSPGMLVFKRFIRNKLAVVGIIILAVMFIFSFIGPFFSPYSRAQLFTKEVEEWGDYATGRFNAESRFMGDTTSSMNSAVLKALGSQKSGNKYVLTEGQEIPFEASKSHYTLRVINPSETAPSCAIFGTTEVAKFAKGELKSYDENLIDQATLDFFKEDAASDSKEKEIEFNGVTYSVERSKVETSYFAPSEEPMAVSTYNIYSALLGKVAKLQADTEFLHSVSAAVNAGETSISYDGETYTLTGDVENGFVLTAANGTELFDITRAFRSAQINLTETNDKGEEELKEVDFVSTLSDETAFNEALKAAINAGETSFTFDEVEYTVSSDEAETYVMLPDGQLAMTVANSFDPIESKYDVLNQDFRFAYATEQAIADGQQSFQYDGEAYTLVNNGADYTVMNPMGEESVLVSDVAYGPAKNGIVLTVDFILKLQDAMRNKQSSFTFVNQYGEETETRITVVNENYYVQTMQTVSLLDARSGLSSKHLLGTDVNGMDVFTRLMYGGRVSLLVGFVVIFFEIILGVIVGGLSGYFGGVVDTILMRFVELFNAIPFYPMLIIVGSVMDNLHFDAYSRLMMTMAMLGILGWTGIARMVRGQILSLREQDFMIATEATGIKTSRRIFRHLVPNVMPLLIVSATSSLGGIIITESTLGFLGLGVKYPMASWGSIINQVNDMQVMNTAWWIWIPAGAFILLTVLGFNFVGDGLRDAFDPKMKR